MCRYTSKSSMLSVGYFRLGAKLMLMMEQQQLVCGQIFLKTFTRHSIYCFPERTVRCYVSKYNSDEQLEISLCCKNKGHTHTHSHSHSHSHDTLSFDPSGDIIPYQLMCCRCVCSCSNRSGRRGSHLTLERSQLTSFTLLL